MSRAVPKIFASSSINLKRSHTAWGVFGILTGRSLLWVSGSSGAQAEMIHFYIIKQV